LTQREARCRGAHRTFVRHRFARIVKIRDNGMMSSTNMNSARTAITALLASACLWSQCAGAQASPPANSLALSAQAAAADVWHGAQDVAIYALGLIGVDYRFGGDSPQSGLDCSGLVRYVFQQVTGVTLPRTSKELSRIGRNVAAGELQPGDLVFFNTRRFQFSHVGIYLGDNRFIHAPSTGSEVEIAQLSESYWQKHFNGARRLVGVLPALIPSVAAAPMLPLEASVAPGGAAEVNPLWSPLPAADGKE
jgi:cell wall-associated NlpC family hydrolase